MTQNSEMMAYVLVDPEIPLLAGQVCRGSRGGRQRGQSADMHRRNFPHRASRLRQTCGSPASQSHLSPTGQLVNAARLTAVCLRETLSGRLGKRWGNVHKLEQILSVWLTGMSYSDTAHTNLNINLSEGKHRRRGAANKGGVPSGPKSELLFLAHFKFGANGMSVFINKPFKTSEQFRET